MKLKILHGIILGCQLVMLIKEQEHICSDSLVRQYLSCPQPLLEQQFADFQDSSLPLVQEILHQIALTRALTSGTELPVWPAKSPKHQLLNAISHAIAGSAQDQLSLSLQEGGPVLKVAMESSMIGFRTLKNKVLGLFADSKQYTHHARGLKQLAELLAASGSKAEAKNIMPSGVGLQQYQGVLYQIVFSESPHAMLQLSYVCFFLAFSLRQDDTLLSAHAVQKQLSLYFEGSYRYLLSLSPCPLRSRLIHEIELLLLSRNSSALVLNKYGLLQKASFREATQLTLRKLLRGEVPKSAEEMKDSLFVAPTVSSSVILKSLVAQSLLQPRFTSHTLTDPLFVLLIRKDLLLRFAPLVSICAEVQFKLLELVTLEQQGGDNEKRGRYLLHTAVALLGHFREVGCGELFSTLLEEKPQLRQWAG